MLTALLFSTTNAADTLASENFVSDDKSFTFSLNIPEDANNNALLFAMEGPAEASWFVSCKRCIFCDEDRC